MRVRTASAGTGLSARLTAIGCGAMRRSDHESEHLFRLLALVPRDDDSAGCCPPARSLNLGDEAPEECVSLGGGPVVHVVDQVGRHP